MTNIKKLISEIGLFFDVLQRDCENFKSGKSTHQWLLESFLKNNEDFEEIITELQMDKSDFLSYLYGIEIRARALRDILNPFNIKVDKITEKLKENNLIPYRISEIEDVDGLCFCFKKETYFVYLEVYSDLEMGYIVDDSINKKIIANVDIQDINEFITYMKGSN